MLREIVDVEGTSPLVQIGYRHYYDDAIVDLVVVGTLTAQSALRVVVASPRRTPPVTAHVCHSARALSPWLQAG
jgi:hypothetical protein